MTSEQKPRFVFRPLVTRHRSHIRYGWLCIPTGGTSGGIKFARHDERTLTASPEFSDAAAAAAAHGVPVKEVLAAAIDAFRAKRPAKE